MSGSNLTIGSNRADIRDYGHAVEIAGVRRVRTRICCVAELPSAAELLQPAVVFPLQHSDQRATARNARRDGIRDASADVRAAFLDAFGLGQRQSADGIRRESAARRGDEENRSICGQNKFLALETAKFGTSAALGRRDGARGREELVRNFAKSFAEES